MQDSAHFWHSASPFPSPDTPRRRSRWLTRVAVLVSSCVLAVAGCAPVYLESAKPTLPQLSDTEDAFQSAVRVDLLIEKSANDVAQDGVEGCESCPQLLESLAERSQERARVLGGMWDPWPEGAPSDAPTAPGLAAPYSEAHIIARQAVEVGLDDLRTAATLEEFDDRIALSSVALGRVSDGIRLARTLSVSESDVQSWFDGALEQVDTPTTSLSETERSDLAQAVQGWDCGAQLLPLYTAGPDTDKGPTTAERIGMQQSEELLRLTTAVLAREVPDTRLSSCVGAFEEAFDSTSSDHDEGAALDAVEEQLLSVALTLYAQHPHLNLPPVSGAAGEVDGDTAGDDGDADSGTDDGTGGVAEEEPSDDSGSDDEAGSDASAGNAEPVGTRRYSLPMEQLLTTLMHWIQVGTVPATPAISVASVPPAEQ